jgi:hypothetical protein
MTGSNQTLSMDVLAEGGVPLRLTVHRTDAGHVELDNLLETVERQPDGTDLPLRAYSVRSFLSSADDSGRVIIPAPDRDLVIEGHWMTTAGDWLVMLSEDLSAVAS